MSIKINVKAVSGSIALSIGNFVYTAILALGSIIIARLLGPADYGVISIALIYPIMFSGLADLGLSTAIMRYASLGDLKNASTALWLRLFVSLLFAAALAPLAPYLATMLQRPYLTPMIYILSIYSFASGALSSVIAFLAGVNRYWDLALVNTIFSRGEGFFVDSSSTCRLRGLRCCVGLLNRVLSSNSLRIHEATKIG